MSVKRLLIFTALLMAFATQTFLAAQTPDNKPKATASVSGRVIVGDKPAPGITVVANLLASPQTLVAQTTTDAEGKYRLSGLTATSLTIGAYAPTYVVPAMPMYAQGRMVLLSADENIEGVDFKLTRGGVITGRVTDAEGKPLIDERVDLTLLDIRNEPVRTTSARPPNPFVYGTDDRGIYRVFGLAAGRYKVSVGDAPGLSAGLHPGYYPKTYHPDASDIAKATIVELTEGGEAKNIDITVGPRSRTYTVSGRIIDADTGQPLPGVNYSFGVLQQNQSQSYLAGLVSPGTPTNSKGEFRLEGVAPGRYALTGPSNFYQPTVDQPKIYVDPVPFEVTDSDLTNLEVKAQHGLTISGVVIPDGITNKNALAGISRLVVVAYVESSATGIQIYGGFTPSKNVAADGTFQVEGLKPGLVTLSISSNGPESRGYSISRITSDRELPNRAVELAPGQNISGVRIYLSYGTGVIKGELKVEGGTLPSDAVMYAFLRRENQSGSSGISGVQVDARGRFIMTGIPAGNYEAILQINSFGPGDFPRGLPRTHRQSVRVSDDSEVQITFTLNLAPREGP